MKKVIFFGNQQALVDCVLYAKSQKNVEISLIVACESEQDIIDGNPSIKDFCKKEKISYINPDKVDSEVLERVRKIEPDVCFSIMYRNIFKPDIIKIPKHGFINMHPSLLPKYRGPVPRLWAMLNDENVLGTTLHYIDEGIDTGDIIDQGEYVVEEDITGYELNIKLNQIGVELFKNNFKDILKSQTKRLKQDHSKASYFGKFNQNLRKINWFDSTKITLRRINMLGKPYTGVTAQLEDSTQVIIWKAIEYNGDKSKLSGPGKIVEKLSDGLVVSTIDGYIKILDFEVSFNSNKFIT